MAPDWPDVMGRVRAALLRRGLNRPGFRGGSFA
jgi:hypothetical protein